MRLRSLWRKRKDVMKFNDKEAESKVRQEAALQALHEENVRLGLYEGVYAIDVLEQENRLLRARNDRLEKELAMYQVQRLGQEIQPERDYERGFIDGMQKQMQSSVDKAVNAMSQRTWVGLTDAEIQECLNGLPTQTIDIYARRIEAKLKEKNDDV